MNDKCANEQEVSVSLKIKKDLSYKFLIIMVSAFIIRMIAAALYRGYEVDINCFLGWSDMIFKKGFSSFYTSNSFTDYPPGYMYFLYVIGAIRNLLHLPYNSVLSILLLKSPAIICDLFTGYLLYKIVRRVSEPVAISSCAFYLLNPAVWFNSSVWGQVDSVFTLFVVLTCYFIIEDSLPKAYFLFAVGILIKPQTLILTPVLLFGIIDKVLLKNCTKKKFFCHLGWGLCAIFSMILPMIPFGVGNVISQYTTTLTSYPYASVNAYNFWNMLGLNWSSQNGIFLFLTYSQWGTIFILLIVIIASFISFKNREDTSKYFFIGAFIVISMFLFSVRMHERYMFPALVLLLIAAVFKNKKELLLLYGLFSFTHLWNMTHVLFYYDAGKFRAHEFVPVFISIINMILFALLIYYTIKFYFFHEEEKNTEKEGISIKEKDGKLTPVMMSESKNITRPDIISILIITVVYAIIALCNLGDRKAPNTSWDTEITGTPIILDLGKKQSVQKLAYFVGNYENREFILEGADTIDGPWSLISNIKMESVFSWEETPINTNSRYLKLTLRSDKAVIFELAVVGADGKLITPVSSVSDIKNLFDEQDLYPARSTFKDSTYFDEIYHARTAYEYIHGLYSYENTHPPLGKIFIALGMLIFGVNPFGWRIMGTLFGIAMLPFIYLFAKRFFKESWIASITTILFAFDFMHFVQTRIATIDVYVTFFIILMYYFMYQYTKITFYDTKLKNTFIPLGLSGISMGFGIACKWTGMYAGGGLAVIFFITLYERYREYKFARSYPEEKTGNIEHSYIIRSFKGNTVKTILFCIVFFVIIPLIIYTLSYIPFVDGVQGRGFIARILNNQESMFRYHTHIDATHPYSSWWYQWPVMYRPIWYYSGHVTDTISEGISAFGNPLVWWAGIPAFLYMLYLSIEKEDKKASFLVIAYLAQYLPWFMVKRITFIYHYFPSVPFVTMMVAYSMYMIVKKKPKMKAAAIAYCCMAVVLFAMFYPVLSGYPVNKNYVSVFLRWFDSWVLVS